MRVSAELDLATAPDGIAEAARSRSATQNQQRQDGAVGDVLGARYRAARLKPGADHPVCELCGRSRRQFARMGR
jgi:hypothetical protein